MTEIQGETGSNQEYQTPGEAIIAELRAIRGILERLEHRADEGAREFLPALRQLLGRRAVRAAGKMWGGGTHP